MPEFAGAHAEGVASSLVEFVKHAWNRFPICTYAFMEVDDPIWVGIRLGTGSHLDRYPILYMGYIWVHVTGSQAQLLQI